MKRSVQQVMCLGAVALTVLYPGFGNAAVPVRQNVSPRNTAAPVKQNVSPRNKVGVGVKQQPPVPRPRVNKPLDKNARAKKGHPNVQAKKSHPHEWSRSCSSSSSSSSSCSSCNKIVKIRSRDVQGIGYTIDAPGEYVLCEDIIYFPNGVYPAIHVAESAVGNITIDLNGKTLSQDNKNTLGVDGIVVDPGLTNVLIKNGTITGFSGNGIQAGEQRTAGLATPATITNLYIEGVNTFNNGSQNPLALLPALIGGGGIVIYNAEDVILKDVNSNENVLAGFFGVDVVDLTVTASHFDNNTWGNYQVYVDSVSTTHATALTTQATTFGFCLISDVCNNGGQLCSTLPANAFPAANVVITNSTFDQNSSVGTAIGLQLKGTGPVSSFNNVVVQGCTVNGTSVTVSDPAVAANFLYTNTFGVNIVGVSGSVMIDNCQISDTSLTLNTPLAGNYGTGAFNSLKGLNFAFCGFATGGGNITVTNCDIGHQFFQNNSGVGVAVGNASVAAFFGISSEMYIANCRFTGNTNLVPVSGPQPTPSLLLVEGLDLSTVSDVLVEDCFAGQITQAAQNPAAGEFSYAAGYKVSSEQSSAIFRRCFASDIIDTGGLGGGAFGFTSRDALAPSSFGVNFIFEECIAENVTNSAGGGAGFDIFNLKNSKVIGNYAEDNDNGIVVSDFAPGASSDNVIARNVLVANKVFGINDTGYLSSTNAYYENQAKNNGSSPAFTVDTTVTTATTLPSATIAVMSTTGFTIPGTVSVTTSTNGVQSVTCTGTTAASFTGCTGGVGTVPVGAVVTQTGASTDTNYSGGILNTTGTPIRLWQLPAPPNANNNNGVHGEELDNISINL